MHRSPNISIHSSTSLANDSKLSMTHSVDDRLFFPDSNFIHLLKRFASEPQMSNACIPTNHTHEQSSRSSDMFNLSTTLTSPLIPIAKESDNDEIHFEDMFHFNCDKTQPVFNAYTDDMNSDQIDDCIKPVTTSTENNQVQVNHQQFNEDILLDTSPSPTTSNDLHCERHFRRRKRRSSLTKNSLTLDESQSTVDLLDKLDIHASKTTISPEVSENSQVKSDDVNSIETKTSTQSDQSPEPVIADEPSASVSRYRGRSKLRSFCRFVHVQFCRTKTSILSSSCFNNSITRNDC